MSAARAARHVVATVELFGRDPAAGARPCASEGPIDREPLLLGHLALVLLARSPGVSIGVVVAELRATRATEHFCFDATILIFFGLAKASALRTLPQCCVLSHLPEALILRVYFRGGKALDLVRCCHRMTLVGADDVIHAGVTDKTCYVCRDALATTTVSQVTTQLEDNTLRLRDILQADAAPEGARSAGSAGLRDHLQGGCTEAAHASGHPVPQNVAASR
mmetsp:Transcript_20235/g.40963  ORF Transcript_20235/g.40963 Transcript_20235/m.40963 type:complete len:221 (-) Transcript_20235:581-1243(-)